MGILEDDVDVIQENNDKNDGNKFVDREVQRQAFELNLKYIDRAGISNDGVLWIYSGVGGIGKTLLLDELKKLTEGHGKKFVRYDFKDGNNMVVTLKALCKNLSTDYQMEFPLFDKGCIYLANKSGEFVSKEQQKAVLESSSMFLSVKKNVSKAFTLQDKSSTAIKAGKSVVDEDILVEGLHTFGEGVKTVAEGITEITPIFKLGKHVFELFDKKIAEREEKKRLKKGSTAYGEIAKKLETLNVEDDPTRIREFLPTLFAQDLSFWLEENNTELIVFFDTYELLTGEERDAKKTVRLSSGDAPIDWWVGKLLAADHVMWVIAGRYELNKIGRVSLVGKDGVRKNFVKSYPVDVFNENWSNQYLQLLGVKEENLRNEIFKLTGGHPFYLHQCSITYNNMRERKLPSIKDFGENRDEIISRAIGSLDENGQLLTQCLCILNRWTDEVAVAVIDNLNNITYRRIKKLFTCADSSSLDDETIYTFDRTIDVFLFPSLKVDVTCSRLFANIRDAVNKFFKNFFDENKQDWYDSGSKPEFYFGMWSEIILRTTDAPAELMTLYDENLAPIEYCFDNARRAEVAEKFFTKVGDTETLPSAYFQYLLGATKFYQGMDEDALELETSAYQKLQRLPLEKENRWLKIAATHCLADIFKNLKRWTDEINLREEIVAECENYYSDADDKRTVNAKENLAQALEHGDRLNDAIELHRRIVESLDGHDDEIFIQAAKNFAATLEFCNRHAEAVPVRKKIVDVYEKIHDDEKTVDALWKLSFDLDKFSDAKTLEEKLACYKKIYRLHEANGREVPADLVTFIADALNKLGLNDEAAQVYKNFIDDLKRRVEVADKPDEKKSVELMVTLAKVLDLTARYNEEQLWRKKITDAVATVISQIREPVKDYDAVISTLKDYSAILGDENYREEQVTLWRKILAFTEKNPDADEAEIVAAKKNLVNCLCEWIPIYSLNEDADTAEELRLFEDVEAYYKKIFPKNFDEFIYKILSEHVKFLYRRKLPTVAKYMEILDFVEKHPKATANQIFLVMDDVALELYISEKYSEALKLRERMLTFCRENFMENSPEVLRTLHFLNLACIKLKAYDKAERYLKTELEFLEKNLDVAHRNVIEVKTYLAETFHGAGKFDDELKLREEIVELWCENFSSNVGHEKFLHEEFVDAQKKFASLLEQLGYNERAADVRSQIDYTTDDDDDIEKLFEQLETLDEEQLAKEMRDFEKLKR